MMKQKAMERKLIPKEIMSICEEESKEIWENGRPRKWYYGIPIILLWLILLVIVMNVVI